MITKKQENWILAIFIVLALDAAISIYGATFSNASFYEANPIMAAAGTLPEFTNLVVITKMLAALTVTIVTAYCNRNIGEEWGDAVCQGSLGVMGILLASILVMNIVVNFV